MENDFIILEFNGEYYQYWSIKMKFFFIGKDFFELIESRYEDPENWDDLQGNEMRIKKEAKKENAMTIFHIQMALDKSLFLRIFYAQTTKEAQKTPK